jgi:hypothetical protein
MYAIYDIQGQHFKIIPEQTQKIRKHSPVIR